MPSPIPPPDASPLQRVATARAVHALDAGQPLDDLAAVAQAAQQGAAPQARVLARAWLLGEALGLPRAWRQLRHLALGAWGALVAVIVLLAWGMTAAVMGQDGDHARINLLGALVSLLGMNALTLVVWLAGVALPARKASARQTPAGGWVQRVVAWGARRAGVPAQRLLAGATQTLNQARATPWVAGLVSHSAWALGFALILVVMGLGFAFRAYQPVVETTILSPQALQRLVDGLGWLPGQLGVARPQVAALGAAGQVAEAAQAAQAVPGGRTGQAGDWAWWLMACVLWYGLVPRALLTAACALVLRRRLARLQLPEDDAGFQWALARFNRLQGTRVIDADRSPAPSARTGDGAAGEGWALLVHELPQQPGGDAALWRALHAALARDAAAASDGPLPPAPVWAGDCDGSAHSVADNVAHLARLNRPTLVVCVAGPASPDRSVARLLRTLAPLCTRVLLWPVWPAALPADERALHHARWADWLRAEVLDAHLLEAA